MVEIDTPSRADVDIAEDVATIVATYPPLQADRHNLQLNITDGVITFSGHLMTPITRRYLIENAATIPGVQDIQASALFDDETTRLDLGRVLPYGVMAHVRYGTALLNGRLPPDVTEEQLAASAAAIPGVRRVVMAF